MKEREKERGKKVTFLLAKHLATDSLGSRMYRQLYGCHVACDQKHVDGRVHEMQGRTHRPADEPDEQTGNCLVEYKKPSQLDDVEEEEKLVNIADDLIEVHEDCFCG